MKVVIIEDEAPAFRRLQRILEELNPNIQIVEVLDSIKESVDWLNKNHSPDLVFMDIQLADGLSFQIFEQCSIQCPIVFTTAYDDYALEAFKVNSIDYLLKPIDKNLLNNALTKYKNLKQQFQVNPDLKEILKSIQPESKSFKSRFLVKQRDKLLSIKSADIAYLITENGTIYLHTLRGKKYVFDRTLDQLEQQLDAQIFFRINRQCIANIDAVQNSIAYDKGKILVELSPKTSFPTLVSREKATEFKKWLGQE